MSYDRTLTDQPEPQPLEEFGAMSPMARRRWDYLSDSARTVRWHTEAPVYRQSVGEHTYSVMMLVMLQTNWKPSFNLLAAALMHDTAERKFGDVPGPTKRLLGLKESFDQLEDNFMESMGLCIPALAEHEQRILKLADNLEGAAFCAFEVRRGNRTMRSGFRNYLNYIASMKPTGWACAAYHELLKEYNDAFHKGE